MSKIDFERAALLMDIIVKAGQHGPLYQKLAGLAGEELKSMLGESATGGKLVTTNAGPNTAIEQKDGSLAPVIPASTEVKQVEEVDEVVEWPRPVVTRHPVVKRPR